MKKTPAWKSPPIEDVKVQVLAWIDKSVAEPAARAKATALWNNVSGGAGEDMLDRLAQTIAVGDPRAAKLIELCSKARVPGSLPSQAWLADPKTLPLVANNLRLFYGRWLVQGAWFDEAVEQIGALAPADVVVPAELLFYQAVVHHRLLNKEEGLKAIQKLLDGIDDSPRRYVVVSQLLQADLSGMEPETLNHIARRMEDIERRLDLGRTGRKVRKVEDGVVESLDKLIKKMEDDQKNQQQQQQQSGGSQSSKPAQASTPMGGRGSGEVTKKNIGSKSGWGDLPPKEREEAVQQVGRDFPSHYRDIVEQYFRRLASEESNDKK